MAKISVIKQNRLEQLGNFKLSKLDIKIKYANESSLEILGKVNLWLELGKLKKVVEFYVAKEISPDMIGGINPLEEFDIELKILETESKPVEMRINSVNSSNNIIGQSYKNEMVKEFQDIFMKYK